MLNKLLMMAAGLCASLGYSGGAYSSPRFTPRGYSRHRVHHRARETARAAWQGLHNTPDGRIERRKGVVVQKGCGYMITAHDDHAVRNTGFGDTRTEAIRDYRNTFFHPETKA